MNELPLEDPRRYGLDERQSALFLGTAISPRHPSDQLHELADELGVTIPSLDNYRDELSWLRDWLWDRANGPAA